MPQIYLCFLWHMHQPFYKNLMTGEYKLPWTRLHALKDYYGMVNVLRDFPEVHQTFNLVPSMLVQVEEYAQGIAMDPFLAAALKPAETLTEQEQTFILEYFFQANPSRLIYRYPRYGELYDAWHAADRNAQRARRFFGVHAIRDLQVLSQIAWFDEEFLDHDAEVRELVRKGRDYSLEDQALVGRKQFEILARVIPVYGEFAARGQIEISTTPFYHPILPLLCDSNIAGTSHPYVPLPSQFRYPEDARRQLQMAREYMRTKLDCDTAGLWPSEGSVSDEVLGLASSLGFRWLATDNGVLARTLNQAAGADRTYRPYLWSQNGRQIHAIFRDHYLSDLIGFIYSRMGAVDAAVHFLDRVRENCAGILATGRDALVPVILDGENAWEHYEKNGRPFLRELYRRITDDPVIHALTISEALRKTEPHVIPNIFPGSWINANFDVWIGAEEDNKAWEYLLRARLTYDRVLAQGGVPPDRQQLAYEELLIAEGSDWCWWYGPEHDSANRPEFDQLYRDHLANVYRALGQTPPEELSRPILKVAVKEHHESPTGPIRPVIDGEVTSYFEWLGAGLYRGVSRSGSMHGQRFLIKQLLYGSDGQNFYLRMDPLEDAAASLPGMDVRIQVESMEDAPRCYSMMLHFVEQGVDPAKTVPGAEFGFQKVLETKIPLAAIGVSKGRSLRFQLSLWQDGLPMDAMPQQGWLEFSTADPSEWPI